MAGGWLLVEHDGVSNAVLIRKQPLEPVALIKTVSINMAFAVDFIFKLRPNIVATEQQLQSRQK